MNASAPVALLLLMVSCGPAAAPPVDAKGPPIPLAALPKAAGPPPPAPPPAAPAEPEPGSIPVTRADPTRGDALAPVTAVSVADATDPGARHLFAVLQEVEHRFGTRKLRRAHKSWAPALRPHAGQIATAANAALRAGGDRAFWAFLELAAGVASAPTTEVLIGWAASAGAPPERFRAALGSPEVAAKVEQDARLARELGTVDPLTVYVNGIECSRRSGFRWSERARAADRLALVIEDELGRARSAHIDGLPASRVYAERTRYNRAEARLPAALAEDLEGGVFAVPVGNSPVRGPASALVTVVELGDYQDPFCKRVQPTLAELRTIYGDDVRFVFKHAPLPFHPLAEPAAELAAEAYARRGGAGFWKAHEAIWTASPKLAMPQLLDIALRSGLDAHVARAAIVDKRHAAVIGADLDLGRLLRASGVPHFFINGRRLVGAQPVEAFRRVIDEELLSARELVQTGVARERVYDEIMRFAMTPPAPPPTPPVAPPPQKPQR